ncbi:MAG TPA: hypothetical protein VII98_08430 [Solirubrobacteraceae bacterium]
MSALVALGVAAPSAMGWNGNLVVRKVNVGGPAADSFAFSLTKNPNAYIDVWDPAAKSFALTGAPGAAGPFTEGTTQKSFIGLWAGHEVGFDGWVDYTVTEAAHAGYSTTASCSIDGAGLWTTANPTTSAYGQWTFATATTPAGATAVTTTVRFKDPVAYTTTCTFTNVYRGHLTLVKHFSGPFSAADRATLAIDDQTKAGVADGGSIGPVEVPGDTSHTISESGVDQGLYATSFDDCGLSGAGAPAGSGLTRTLTVPAGRDVVCNVTNRRRSGTLTLAKVVNPAGAGKFNLTLDGANTTVAGSAGDATFGNGDASVPAVVATGDHVIAERAATPGQTLAEYTSSVACVNRAGQGAPVPVATGGTITVHDGDDVLCTFTNAKIPASGVAPVPPTGGGSSSTSGGGTTPTTPPVRSSRIVGPSACLSRAHATVGVRGHGIASVAFSVGGRHLRTVRTRDANGVYALVVRTRTLPRGATIVVARVTFRGAARPRTLRLRLSRCATRSVRPTFTG